MTVKNWHKSIALGLFIFLTNANLQAQTTPPSNLEGLELRTWFKQNWYDGHQNISTSTSSGYRNARLEMYNSIDVVNGKLYGFYSGYSINVPSQGFDAPSDISPMDCEHIVPQSLFNSAAPMKNDIFHLRPTYSNWNSTRSNLPFRENNDLQTTKWMRFDDAITCNNNASCLPDAGIIDEFSEVISGQSWEPREIVKGDVARSVFYFFTMYPQYNIASVGNIELLHQWHLEDPADAQEINRNNLTEDYQGNRNPYIDNPDWVQRAWLPNYTPTTANTEIVRFVEKIYPVPASQFLNLELNQQIANYSFKIVDIQGKLIKEGILNTQNSSNHQIDLARFYPGTYFIQLTNQKAETEILKFVKY